MKIIFKIISWCMIMEILNIFVIIFMNSDDLNIFKWLMFSFSSIIYLMIIIDIIRIKYDNYVEILHALSILSFAMDLVLFMIFSIAAIMDNPNVMNILITSIKWLWFIVLCIIVIRYMNTLHNNTSGVN